MIVTTFTAQNDPASEILCTPLIKNRPRGWNIYPNLQALLPWTLTCGVLSRTLQDLRHNSGMWCVTIPPQAYNKYATMLYVVINMALTLVVDNSGMCNHRSNLDTNTVGWGGNIDHGCLFVVSGATAPNETGPPPSRGF
jgi:hypothetical protein